ASAARSNESATESPCTSLIVQRLWGKVGWVHPAGVQFFAAHDAFIEATESGVGIQILLKDVAAAKHPWVFLRFQLGDHLLAELLLKRLRLRFVCQIREAI